MNNLNKTAENIHKLISLGYAAEDIQVLPDGTLTIVPADEMKSSALAVKIATAPARLARMLQRKEKLDEEFKLNTAVPLQMTAEQMHNYFSLLNEIDQTNALLSIRRS